MKNGTRLGRIPLLCTKSAVLSAVADRHDPVTRYLASGSGRTWNCTAIGMPLPPSCSHGVRSPLEVHSPRPSESQDSKTDRFYDTDLDKLLKAQGITTMIMVGWKVSGSVTYTSVGAMIRDYTVVIPVDTTTASSDYETAIGFYNVLNSGNANLTNEPLKPKSVTLSRTDLIAFQ